MVYPRMASLQLRDERTVYSRFKMPWRKDVRFVSYLMNGSQAANDLYNARIILWDQVISSHKGVIAEVDIVLNAWCRIAGRLAAKRWYWRAISVNVCLLSENANWRRSPTGGRCHLGIDQCHRDDNESHVGAWRMAVAMQSTAWIMCVICATTSRANSSIAWTWTISIRCCSMILHPHILNWSSRPRCNEH